MSAAAGVSRLEAVGTIYFVQSGDRSYVKVGWATDVASRLVGLQCGNPDTLSVIATVAGTLRDELAWHRRLAFAAHRAEWFALTPDVQALIDQRETVAFEIWNARQDHSTGDEQFDRWRALIREQKKASSISRARPTALTAEMVRQIHSDRRSVRALAADLGVSKTAVQDVRTGRSWGHLSPVHIDRGEVA